MFNLERWQEIFETIGKNKLRTFLTGLSVASGIFILVILLGVGQGMQNGIAKEFSRDAANSIKVFTWMTTVKHKGLNPGRFIDMTNEDKDMISRSNSEFIQEESPLVRIWGGMATYGKESGSYRIEGVDAGYQKIENQDLNKGRFISFSDVRQKAKVVVIGDRVKKDLFKNEKDFIGEYIIINQIPFKVIGSFKDPGGEREEQILLVPYTTAQLTFNRGQNVNSLTYTLQPEETFDATVAKSQKFAENISSYLKTKHIVAPEDESAIRVWNTLEVAKRFYSLMFMIKGFFWWVGICTIIAGVVGVSNIMLIIVKERTKEIGIRKAIGALPSSIIGMILHEAIFITTIAGFSGLIFGLALLEVVGPMVETEYLTNPSVNFNVALTTVFILIIAGAIAGAIPAWRAARIKPIIALRDE